jgi:hypothetical protein
MLGDSNYPIRQRETGLPQEGAENGLLPTMTSAHTFVRVVHVDDPPPNGQSQGGYQVHGADQIVMTMKRVVFPADQFPAERSNKSSLGTNRHRRVHYRRTELLQLCFQSATALKFTIKRPPKGESSLLPEPEHARQPVFHRASIQVFNNMEDRRLVCTLHLSASSPINQNGPVRGIA